MRFHHSLLLCQRLKERCKAVLTKNKSLLSIVILQNIITKVEKNCAKRLRRLGMGYSEEGTAVVKATAIRARAAT